MQIPEYFIKALYSHYRRIAGHARCDPKDTRTVNALRLARADLRRLEKYLNHNP